MLYMIGILVDKQLVSRDYDHITWAKLIKDFSLTNEQTDQLQRYVTLLIEWNKKFNLTAILDPARIVQYHLYDSMKIADYIDFTRVSSIADIGTGAGFPGIPLKILFPHLRVVLIEVNNKKRAFLEHLIKEFELVNVSLSADDWRTFLRGTANDIDYFFARASLQPEDLVRIFKPSSFYKGATLVYWASAQWVPGKHEAVFVQKEVEYTIDDVQRKYVFLKEK